MDAKIVAVVVTFNPDRAEVTALVRCLLATVSRVVVVDNTPETSVIDVSGFFEKIDGVEVHQFHENKGIATAFNFGISVAKGLGAEFVLLSDQDSSPDAEMIPNLLAAFRQLQRSGEEKIAAVGPVYVDGRDGSVSPFVCLGRVKFKLVAPSSAEPVLKVLAMISSGSLIPIAALDAVGGMREELFIDLVDTEWCLRAGAAGYNCYAVHDARMVHPIGDNLMRIGFFKKIYVPMHSPLRLYYQFRNAFYLYKDCAIPFAWKISDFIYRIGVFRAYLFFANDKARYLASFFLGFCHGLISKMGRKGV